jgi:hypothetical protein
MKLLVIKMLTDDIGGLSKSNADANARAEPAENLGRTRKQNINRDGNRYDPKQDENKDAGSNH